MADTTKKDSTNDLPMYSIMEAIELASIIHDKALETAAMPDVAKGCGYANPTSTPFYRRMVAARLFKLIGSPKPELTTLAKDYLKPDTDGAKQAALTQAIMGIKTYADIVNLNVGKKINADLLANKLEKDDSLSISKSCAKSCASVFLSSIKFAGFISPDGIVMIPGGADLAATSTPSAAALTPPKTPKPEELEADEESQVQTLFLDNKRKRKITIKAPFTVTTAELERIKSWLGFQLIIEDSSGDMPAQ